MMRCTFGALLLAMSGCVDAFPDLADPPDGTVDARADAQPDSAAPDAAPVDMRRPDASDCVPRAEACNGVDDNCNGVIDENQPRLQCDRSLGVCAGTTVACIEGRYGECNYALANPAYEAEESRCDMLDNDCDGRTDEGCACMPDETRPCGSAEGACEPGVMRCVEGVFGACEGAIEAQPEVCNTIDDDCDGDVDDVEGPCETGLAGRCAGGTRSCEGGVEICVPTIMPAAEACNGIDDDCNGLVDDGLDDRPCDTGEVGLCSAGLTRCDGEALRCMPGIEPGARVEQCNGVDDDCDGEIDNLAPDICVSGQLGECSRGLRACNNRGETYCAAVQQEQPEICDRLDNDCDGVTDENIGGDPCQPDLAESACARGRTTCVNGALRCVGVEISDDDATCDGVDDDCDQKLDEDFDDARCETGIQRCPNGRLACVERETICVPNPTRERDNGPDDIDQDCDGEVDEDTLVVYFEDLMMDGDGRRPGVNRGPVPGYANATVRQGRVFDPELSPVEIVNYVFRPLPNGLTQVTSSNEFTYDFSEHVGSLQSWSPPAKGPWEYQGDRGVPPLTSPHMLELHANMGITFDLAVLTAQYPDHELHQMRSRAGSSDRGSVRIMLLVDGELHDESPCMARRGDGPQLDTLSNLDGGSLRDARYITFAAVNCGANNINNMHGLLHDARIIMRPRPR